MSVVLFSHRRSTSRNWVYLHFFCTYSNAYLANYFLQGNSTLCRFWWENRICWFRDKHHMTTLYWRFFSHYFMSDCYRLTLLVTYCCTCALVRRLNLRNAFDNITIEISRNITGITIIRLLSATLADTRIDFAKTHRRQPYTNNNNFMLFPNRCVSLRREDECFN